MKRSLGLALATIVSVVLGAAPAVAQQTSVDDAPGDASNHDLDITRVTVQNLDHSVVVKVRFVASVRGDLIVSLDPRQDRGLRMISEYDPVGHTDNFLLGRAFTDHRGGQDAVPCKGFRVRWSADEPTVTMRMPSHCLAGGDYGAVRFAALTEGASGGDADGAPQRPNGDVGSSAWVPRG